MKYIALAVLGLLPLCPASAAETDVLATLRTGHPRLLFTDGQLAAAVAAAKTDPLRAQLHAYIVNFAGSLLDAKPIEHVLIGPRLLDKSRACVTRVLTCAMAFRLTGDARFSERAKKEMLVAAAFPDWNPSHFLDVAEMTFAIAVGYDWLYQELTPADRAVIKRALLEKSLFFAPAAYLTPSVYVSGSPTDVRLTFVRAKHNWNQVCNGGLLAGALALADEEPELARLVVNGALKSLPISMAAYQPDGAYPEGPDYWGYGTGYNVIAIALLESALGTDFDLSAAPAFDRTALYRLHVQSPSGQEFNYADCDPRDGADAQYTWLASRFHIAAALAHSRILLTEAVRGFDEVAADDNLFALNAVWFPQDVGLEAVRMTPLDIRFRGPAQLALFRGAWADPRALFVGLKAGRNSVNHAHLDLGSFVLDADGERWAMDLGPDYYNLPAYFGEKRWTYYRLNNRSHNVVTPGNELQDVNADVPIIAFKSDPARAFAVADLTSAYPNAAGKILRGMVLLDRARVLVQDDITDLKTGTPLTWRMLTRARVALADARSAILTQNGRTLRADILAPEAARFSERTARPPTAAENQNEGVTELEIGFTPDASSARIAVLLTPVGDHWPSPQAAPDLTPISEWK
jgi:hypothetical protein